MKYNLEEIKKEILSFNPITALPISINNFIERKIRSKITPNQRIYIQKASRIIWITVTTLSITALPILYIYNRDRDEPDSPLASN